MIKLVLSTREVNTIEKTAKIAKGYGENILILTRTKQNCIVINPAIKGEKSCRKTF